MASELQSFISDPWFTSPDILLCIDQPDEIEIHSDLKNIECDVSDERQLQFSFLSH
jgi:hypothetical protein